MSYPVLCSQVKQKIDRLCLRLYDAKTSEGLPAVTIKLMVTVPGWIESDGFRPSLCALNRDTCVTSKLAVHWAPQFMRVLYAGSDYCMN